MKTVVIVLAFGILATAVPAAASRGRAAGTLQLANVYLRGSAVGVTCPSDAPKTTEEEACWTIANAGAIRGLGTVSESGTLVIVGPHTACEDWRSTSVLTVAGKGTIDLSARNACNSGTTSGANLAATEDFTVSGGTGAYANASGSGTVKISGIAQGNVAEALDGTLVAPAATFDLTPPVISGPSAKIVRAPKGKKSVRVHYAVSANDDVDGSLPAACTPASGSSFRVGRTRVTCTATDSSANTATASFTVTVKR